MLFQQRNTALSLRWWHQVEAKAFGLQGFQTSTLGARIFNSKNRIQNCQRNISPNVPTKRPSSVPISPHVPICLISTDHLQSSGRITNKCQRATGCCFIFHMFRFTLNVANIANICRTGLAAFGSRQTRWIARLRMPAISGTD